MCSIRYIHSTRQCQNWANKATTVWAHIWARMIYSARQMNPTNAHMNPKRKDVNLGRKLRYDSRCGNCRVFKLENFLEKAQNQATWSGRSFFLWPALRQVGQLWAVPRRDNLSKIACLGSIWPRFTVNDGMQGSCDTGLSKKKLNVLNIIWIKNRLSPWQKSKENPENENENSILLWEPLIHLPLWTCGVFLWMYMLMCWFTGLHRPILDTMRLLSYRSFSQIVRWGAGQRCATRRRWCEHGSEESLSGNVRWSVCSSRICPKRVQHAHPLVQQWRQECSCKSVG